MSLHAHHFDNCCGEDKGFYADNLYVWNSEARYYDRQDLTKRTQKSKGESSHNV